MAEKVLQTKIALLYKTYAQWDAIKTTYVPLKGEVCFCEVPAQTGISQTEPCVLFKVGDGTKTFQNLPWASALAADVYAWAKKENLEWADFTDSLKESIKEYVGGMESNTLYQIVSAGTNKWQLQKSDDKGVTWVDATGTIDLSTTITNLEANIAKKPDKEITSANGKAVLWNEASGGGAQFIHNDGTESFVGVNDGGKDGLVAQIYADRMEDGSWKGSKINVYHKGIYYVSYANQKAGYAKDASEMEIATKKDIQDLGQALHFVGIAEKQEGETEIQAVERTFPAAQQKAGAVAICGSKEFICCGNPLTWREFGDVSQYATKAELEAEANERAAADSTLQANIDAEAATRAAEDNKKVDKEITSAEGKALIFNEADGGGAKFENTNGINSFVGVNNGASDEDVKIAAQIYAVDTTTSGHNLGAKLDVTVDGMYYTTGAASGARPSKRQETKNEIAVKGDVAEEATARQAADAALQSGKLDVLPNVDDPTDPGYGWPYHIPYDVAVTPATDKIDLTLKTLTLDNKVTKMNFNKSLPCATQSAAGLMTATDKAKLDHFYAKDLTQEEGDILILNCNI